MVKKRYFDDNVDYFLLGPVCLLPTVCSQVANIYLGLLPEQDSAPDKLVTKTC